jgi:hypothetical protein
LARAIVREAGLSQDPEQTALTENDKPRADHLMTILLLDTAFLASLATIAAFLPNAQHTVLLVWSMLLIVTSITTGLGGLHCATWAVGKDADWDHRLMGVKVRTIRDAAEGLATLLLLVAATLAVMVIDPAGP